jgi:hypothetical protein
VRAQRVITLHDLLGKSQNLTVFLRIDGHPASDRDAVIDADVLKEEHELIR